MSAVPVIRMPEQNNGVMLRGYPMVFLVTGEDTKHTSMFDWTIPPGFATGLHGRSSAPDDDDVSPELLEDAFIAAPESFARGRENDDRDHSPQDPEHRQEAAELVRAKVREDLTENHPGRTTLSPALSPLST